MEGYAMRRWVLGGVFTFWFAVLMLLSACPAQAQSATPLPLRMNSGGPQFVDSGNLTWVPDNFFQASTTSVSTSTAPVANTNDDALYQNYRFGAKWGYVIPIANGPVRVRLHFIESFFMAAARRVFDVSIEGQVVVNDLDPFVAGGNMMNVAVVRTVSATVSDGVLNIDLVASIDNAAVAAIEVEQVPTSYRFSIYTPGTGGGPVGAPLDVPTTALQCDQPPPTPQTPPVINPTRWVFDDFLRVGRVCIFPDAARFDQLGDGSYEGAVASSSSVGVGPESPRIPFSRLRPQPPLAPTGVMVLP